jgi:hypothetical protein
MRCSQPCGLSTSPQKHIQRLVRRRQLSLVDIAVVSATARAAHRFSRSSRRSCTKDATAGTVMKPLIDSGGVLCIETLFSGRVENRLSLSSWFPAVACGENEPQSKNVCCCQTRASEPTNERDERTSTKDMLHYRRQSYQIL